MKVEIDIDVPEGTRWMAQDQNGEWWFFKNKPTPKHGMWVDMDGDSRFAYPDRPSKDWKSQLYEVY